MSDTIIILYYISTRRAVYDVLLYVYYNISYYYVSDVLVIFYYWFLLCKHRLNNEHKLKSHCFKLKEFSAQLIYNILYIVFPFNYKL